MHKFFSSTFFKDWNMIQYSKFYPQYNPDCMPVFGRGTLIDKIGKPIKHS